MRTVLRCWLRCSLIARKHDTDKGRATGQIGLDPGVDVELVVDSKDLKVPESQA
jgi:hypothetical protein